MESMSRCVEKSCANDRAFVQMWMRQPVDFESTTATGRELTFLHIVRRSEWRRHSRVDVEWRDRSPGWRHWHTTIRIVDDRHHDRHDFRDTVGGKIVYNVRFWLPSFFPVIRSNSCSDMVDRPWLRSGRVRPKNWFLQTDTHTYISMTDIWPSLSLPPTTANKTAPFVDFAWWQYFDQTVASLRDSQNNDLTAWKRILYITVHCICIITWIRSIVPVDFKCCTNWST